jgi:hypothetical protein
MDGINFRAAFNSGTEMVNVLLEKSESQLDPIKEALKGVLLGIFDPNGSVHQFFDRLLKTEKDKVIESLSSLQREAIKFRESRDPVEPGASMMHKIEIESAPFVLREYKMKEQTVWGKDDKQEPRYEVRLYDKEKRFEYCLNANNISLTLEKFQKDLGSFLEHYSNSTTSSSSTSSSPTNSLPDPIPDHDRLYTLSMYERMY